MLLKKDIIFLEKLIDKFQKKEKTKKLPYSLLDDGFSSQDIIDGIEVLLSKKITMSEITKNFEKEFSKSIGAKYALMVNSGSSANLLVAFGLVNPLKKNGLKKGDEFIIPSLCWSTSLWPMIQAGLKPNFIDVDLESFCLDEKLLDQKKYKKSKAIMNLHILGNCSKIDEITKYAKKNNMFLIEDTCEALGSKYLSKHLGTFGDFGTYSFYYSHQITSGEGGMIVCKNKEDYQLLYTLRAHGWDRGLSSSSKSNNFNFINSGFNLRPLDLTAAIGLSQFRRLKNMMKIRKFNRDLIIENFKKSEKWDNQFSFFKPRKGLEPSWFGFPILINSKFIKDKEKFLRKINSKGIETRPILSGNFLNQPSAKLYKLYNKMNVCIRSQEIEDRGFFIGLPTSRILKSKVDFLIKNLLTIQKNDD
tara:strand:- start:15502 stop:16755 length:1254 start_codon:yes stop_codon:yes gene_type:complete